MAEQYDFHSALKRRLDSILASGDAATSWARLQQQKRAADALSAQASGLERSFARQPVTGAPVASSGDAGFDSFLSAIAGKESGGNYNARNKSSGAMGKYQIMPGNLGGTRSGWDYEALGYDVSPAQFMGSPQIQEAIARYKLKQYYDKWGPAGAAVAWYSGPRNVAKKMNSTAKQGAYPSISSYSQDVLRRMGR